MARKIALIGPGGDGEVLTEDAIALEEDLQELVKRNPELLPYEDFDLSGPLMVISRETRVRSGAADLIAVAPSGAILLVEFKRGKENPDARHALAQMLDYGSHLWQMTYDDLDALAVTFSRDQGANSVNLSGRSRIAAAAQLWWAGVPDFSFDRFRDQLTYRLEKGEFEYVLAARDFPDALERTITYLNQAMPSRFFAVELVLFASGEKRAYEARTVRKPPSGRPNQTATYATEAEFLASIASDAYRKSLQDLFQWCRLQQLSFEWGTRGTSIRLRNRDRSEPISIAWAFPTGAPGWMGLTNVSFGFDATTAAATPSLAGPLQEYVTVLRGIDGGIRVERKSLTAAELDERTLPIHLEEIKAAIASLVAGGLGIAGDA